MRCRVDDRIEKENGPDSGPGKAGGEFSLRPMAAVCENIRLSLGSNYRNYRELQELQGQFTYLLFVLNC
jgi:hypothetical protein